MNGSGNLFVFTGYSRSGIGRLTMTPIKRIIIIIIIIIITIHLHVQLQ